MVFLDCFAPDLSKYFFYGHFYQVGFPLDPLDPSCKKKGATWDLIAVQKKGAHFFFKNPRVPGTDLGYALQVGTLFFFFFFFFFARVFLRHPPSLLPKQYKEN